MSSFARLISSAGPPSTGQNQQSVANLLFSRAATSAKESAAAAASPFTPPRTVGGRAPASAAKAPVASRGTDLAACYVPAASAERLCVYDSRAGGAPATVQLVTSTVYASPSTYLTGSLIAVGPTFKCNVIETRIRVISQVRSDSGERVQFELKRCFKLRYTVGIDDACVADTLEVYD